GRRGWRRHPPFGVARQARPPRARRSVPRALGGAGPAGGTPRVRTRPHAPSHRPRHRALSRLSTWTPAVRRGPRTHPTALGHLVNAFVSPRVLLPTTPGPPRLRPSLCVRRARARPRVRDRAAGPATSSCRTLLRPQPASPPPPPPPP